MGGQVGKVDKSKATEQWTALCETLQTLDAVTVIDGFVEWPDMVFAANAGIVSGKKAIVSTFANSQRAGESFLFAEWFRKLNLVTCMLSYPYEGQGDHLIDAHGRHWVGSGFRTSAKCKNQLESVIDNDVTVLELVDPRWYHLDTAFCPLSDGTLMWYPGAFSKSSQQLIHNAFGKQIIVSESDAEKFCCNSVCVGSTVIIPNNDQVSDSLRNVGFDPVELDFSEFIKAGGAAKCLCLEFDLPGK
jgi:N-dimethylarginine dimethylaminohydrolase